MGLTHRLSREHLGVGKNPNVEVRKYVRSPGVPREKPRCRRTSKLDPYAEYIDGRLSEGLENCVVLLRELRALGYSGGYTILKDYVQPRRRRKQPRATVSRLRSTGVAWHTSQRTAASAGCERS